MGTSSNSKKTFAVISVLDEEGAVEVIPTMWILNSSHAKWPNIISPNTVYKFIKECKSANEKWRTIKIKIYGYSNSFENAKYKANVVQTTLNMNSDSSEEEELRVSRRKRKRPARFETNDYLLLSDIESTEDNKSKNIQGKRKIISENLEIESSENEDRKTSPKKQRKFTDVEINDDSPYVSEEESSDNEGIRSKPIIHKKQSNIHTNNDPSNLSEEETIQKQKRSSIPGFSEGTSEPSWDQILNESSTDCNSQLTKFSCFFKYLDLLHGQVNELNTRCETLSSQVEQLTKHRKSEALVPYFSPSDFQLPADSDEALSELNEKLKNKDLCKSLIYYLSESSCGKSPGKLAINMMKKVITQELALNYSLHGKRGKKSFSDHQEIFNCMLVAARLKLKHVDKQDLLFSFGKALAAASVWKM